MDMFPGLQKMYWREDSIKTRIETKVARSVVKRDFIEEKIPLKQGLKPVRVWHDDQFPQIEEKIPLKQGLKPNKAFGCVRFTLELKRRFH